MEVKQCSQFYYRVQEGDSLLKICNKFNTSKDSLKRNNESLDLYVGEWLIIKTNDYKTHYVKPAEKLTDIALKYNTNVEKLKQDNNLQNERLYIGQMLKIY